MLHCRKDLDLCCRQKAHFKSCCPYPWASLKSNSKFLGLFSNDTLLFKVAPVTRVGVAFDGDSYSGNYCPVGVKYWVNSPLRQVNSVCSCVAVVIWSLNIGEKAERGHHAVA